MKIDWLKLAWFRGAAQHATLDCGSRNIVVYGANGSGKSSFADALEYLMASGRIAHLAHEYSGARQEKGIRNTHTPEGEQCEVNVGFQDGSSVGVLIGPDGTASFEGTPEERVAMVQSWATERTVLRQDELASFIHSTKGQKYSVLLPLLGLSHLEHTAENLHRLRDTIEKRANLSGKKQRLADLKEVALQYMPDTSPKAVKAAVRPLLARYVLDKTSSSLPALLDQLETVVERRVASSEPEQRRHSALQEMADEKLAEKLEGVRLSDRAASRAVSELVDRRIPILEEAAQFIGALAPGLKKVDCPACGRPIEVQRFAEHVRSELEALQTARETRSAALGARKALATSVANVVRKAHEQAVETWLGRANQKQLKSAFDGLAKLHPLSTSERWDRSAWKGLQQFIGVIAPGVALAARRAPPSAKLLLEDSRVISACRRLPEIQRLDKEIGDIELVVRALERAEDTVRRSIRERAEAIIEAISQNVQHLWGRLHPDEPITNVRLYFAEDEKAIDVALTFFGVDQPSPRLTLSEGHRNSLGLCIFLAMVLQEGDQDRPIVLDDVVSSFDREHRGMLVDILLADLSDGQVILLTHDREWYAELRRRLPASQWTFRSLRPWEDPQVGIQWAQSVYAFDDVRVLVKVKSEAAGNTVRSIMDAEMAMVAEALRIRLPYARGDRNDSRTCIEFLENLISDGKKNLRKKNNGGYAQFLEPVASWDRAHRLLLAWANRASHTGSLTQGEVVALIEACEAAVRCFKCTICGDPIWSADQVKKESLQCTCGTVQWRYG